jgi:hypothetical protein
MNDKHREIVFRLVICYQTIRDAEQRTGEKFQEMRKSLGDLAVSIQNAFDKPSEPMQTHLRSINLKKDQV